MYSSGRRSIVKFDEYGTTPRLFTCRAMCPASVIYVIQIGLNPKITAQSYVDAF